MSQQLLRKVSATFVKPVFTNVGSGDRVRVYTTVKEGNKERTQYFEGLVIRRRGGVGPEATFTVRRITSGVGVERTFALHSPKITKIEVQRGAKVRRSQLHYMRERAGKAARMKEVPVRGDEREVRHPWLVSDQPVAPEKPPVKAAAKRPPKAKTPVAKQTAAKTPKADASATKKPEAKDKQ